ncbi:hypothetical protein EJ08DRAFT_647075 [Tothia fuscella]|uniref:PDZ GRASP-type domain-containing protein n=1 Tax=Tothia fuscella TaxID=1048955 RepID=A0A9P4U294_9PEZI|nr:hypothetical protein EJ08DRAFT_647075 [Tothia fuscella]
MFGALNRFIGRLDGDPQNEQHSTTSNACGFQVLRNKNTTDLPLEPWFDFIIGINGRTIDNPSPHLLTTELHNCAGTSISLGIWSAKGQRIREIYVPIPKENPSLGLSLQWQQLSSTDDVWHIMDVAPNSPADIAGLLPYGDYVIGASDVVVRGEGGLVGLVEDNIDHPIKLLVYNHEYNVTRPVDITPSKTWGGLGSLGCTLGFGALHRIPAPLEEPPAGPGETLFSTDSHVHHTYPLPNEHEKSASPIPGLPSTQSHAISSPPTPQLPIGDFLVPANIPTLQSSNPIIAPPPAKKKVAQRAHHVVSPNSGLDQYFQEGEAKSREEDHGSSSKSGAGIPPPPKIGGPPKGLGLSPGSGE